MGKVYGKLPVPRPIAHHVAYDVGRGEVFYKELGGRVWITDNPEVFDRSG
jgi:hypothetical protein